MEYMIGYFYRPTPTGLQRVKTPKSFSIISMEKSYQDMKDKGQNPSDQLNPWPLLCSTPVDQASDFFAKHPGYHVSAQQQERPCANLTNSESSRITDSAIAQAKGEYNMTFANFAHHIEQLCLERLAHQTSK
jgi:hypothetical protein